MPVFSRPSFDPPITPLSVHDCYGDVVLLPQRSRIGDAYLRAWLWTTDVSEDSTPNEFDILDPHPVPYSPRVPEMAYLRVLPHGLGDWSPSVRLIEHQETETMDVVRRAVRFAPGQADRVRTLMTEAQELFKRVLGLHPALGRWEEYERQYSYRWPDLVEELTLPPSRVPSRERAMRSYGVIKFAWYRLNAAITRVYLMLIAMRDQEPDLFVKAREYARDASSDLSETYNISADLQVARASEGRGVVVSAETLQLRPDFAVLTYTGTPLYYPVNRQAGKEVVTLDHEIRELFLKADYLGGSEDSRQQTADHAPVDTLEGYLHEIPVVLAASAYANKQRLSVSTVVRRSHQAPSTPVHPYRDDPRPARAIQSSLGPNDARTGRIPVGTPLVTVDHPPSAPVGFQRMAAPSAPTASQLTTAVDSPPVYSRLAPPAGSWDSGPLPPQGATLIAISQNGRYLYVRVGDPSKFVYDPTHHGHFSGTVISETSQDFSLRPYFRRDETIIRFHDAFSIRDGRLQRPVPAPFNGTIRPATAVRPPVPVAPARLTLRDRLSDPPARLEGSSAQPYELEDDDAMETE